MKSITYSIGLSLVFLISTFSAHAQEIFCSKYKGSTDGKRLEIDDHRSDSVDIIHTTILLDFTAMSLSTVSGYSEIELRALKNDVNEVRFDFEGLTVDSISGPEGISYTHQSGLIRISFQEPIDLTNSTQVRIYYHGTPIMDASGWGGFYFQGGFAWNLGVGFAADPHSYGRIWFPCFDNFIERSTFEFYIETPSDKFASCNGALIDSSTTSSGTKLFHWRLDQPIPSYLTCVAIGSYEVLESEFIGTENTFPIQLFARANDTANLLSSFIHLNDAIATFEEAYGEYKFNKVGYSLVPFNSGAMEHATNIAYPISAANGGLGQESLMTHELAHMWWGDNVTCQTDGDIWLNEGWASFSEYLVDEAVYGRDRYEASMLSDLIYMLQFGHHFEESYRPVSGQPHEYVYGDHVYKKGALVAHNLRGYLGDDAFFTAAAAFMDAYQFQPVSSDSLERFFSIHSGQDLSYFFRDWVFNGGYNVIVLDSFTTEPNSSGYRVELYLQQKLKGTSEFYENTPVHYTIYDQNWNSIKGKVMMSGQFSQVDVNSPIEPAWIVVNQGNELAQARTADQLVITEEGVTSLPNALMNISVEEIQDSCMLRIEHVWSNPDPIKDFDNKPYKMSDYRYWRYSGLGVENAEISASFFYDGRTGGSVGYLDINLLENGEDSLVLLHRSSAHEDWDEYAFYSKNTLGSSFDGLGLIELSKLLPGEYVLANIDHRVLNVEQANSTNEKVKVYPNPSNGSLIIEQDDRIASKIEFYSGDGRWLKTFELGHDHNQITLDEIANGVLIYRLKGISGETVGSGRVVLER
ncbi:MAG: M1 family aminopeptidase [Salibacteraceae bacterium]